jgi:hypothetical protein
MNALSEVRSQKERELKFLTMIFNDKKKNKVTTKAMDKPNLI